MSVLRRHENPRESGAPILCATKSGPSSSRGYCGLNRLLGCSEGSEGEVVRPRSSFTGQPILAPAHDDGDLFKYHRGLLCPCLSAPTQWNLVFVCGLQAAHKALSGMASWKSAKGVAFSSSELRGAYDSARQGQVSPRLFSQESK